MCVQDTLKAPLFRPLTLFPPRSLNEGNQDLELPLSCGGVELVGDPPDTDATSSRPPSVQRNNPASVSAVPALSSSVALVDTMAALWKHYPPSLGDNGAPVHPGRAEQRPDLLSGAFFL